VDGRLLSKAMTPYRIASDARAGVELAITAVPLLLLWAAALLLARAGMWAGLLLTVPAGAFLLRLFLIQHDCGHGSFFRTRRWNAWTGRAIGVLTFTPYEDWRHSHAAHHATTGNLDKRGAGDIDTLTLDEYRALSARKRWSYRLYRHPVVLFGIGPAYQFLLRHRVPAALARRGWRPWLGVMATNAAIAALCGALILLAGWKPFLLVQVPILLVAATSGVWLFYIQHQFPDTIWSRDERWSFHEAALQGSSYYDLPAPLRWITANIGAHHVHHLCSTIPFYRMPAVLRSFPELTRVGRIGMRDSLRTVRLTLWNEAGGRMISFRDAESG
jgi:omega-6 fatty acid desaturase (delta-12 desaturase)